MERELPAYKRIEKDLRQKFASGEYLIGDRLPGISELCAEYGITGVQTVRNAYQPLIAAGIVEARQGAGYYLAARPEVSRKLETTTAPSLLLENAERLLEMIKQAQDEISAFRHEVLPEPDSVWTWITSEGRERVRVDEVGWNGEDHVVVATNLDRGHTFTHELSFWIQRTTL
ncbi:GntR family transcriptional regulator [Agromyces sp. NPDC057679]|uniref:GntR family transcriptional regulator n=1 Tax=Agromyces sp. NPDC057679 TaxID=3346207 RepID=UPI00366A6D2E